MDDADRQQDGAPPPPPSQQQQQQQQPTLDFFSRAFDPAAALAAPGLRPPQPGARPLDSIYRCRFMLPDGHPDAWREAPKAVKSKEAQEAAAREKSRVSYLQQKQEQQQLKVNPLDAIAQRVREGPLLLLKRCYAERTRVRVVTRHARGVRGTSEGTLVAFDKHMNLVLRDVEERYTVLLNIQRPRPPGPDGRERMRSARKQEHRRRQLRQVFVRGDSVVLVAALAPPPGAAAAAAAGAARGAGAGASAAAAAAAVGSAAAGIRR